MEVLLFVTVLYCLHDEFQQFEHNKNGASWTIIYESKIMTNFRAKTICFQVSVEFEQNRIWLGKILVSKIVVAAILVFHFWLSRMIDLNPWIYLKVFLSAKSTWKRLQVVPTRIHGLVRRNDTMVKTAYENSEGLKMIRPWVRKRSWNENFDDLRF